MISIIILPLKVSFAAATVVLAAAEGGLCAAVQLSSSSLPAEDVDPPLVDGGGGGSMLKSMHRRRVSSRLPSVAFSCSRVASYLIQNDFKGSSKQKEELSFEKCNYYLAKIFHMHTQH